MHQFLDPACNDCFNDLQQGQDRDCIYMTTLVSTVVAVMMGKVLCALVKCSNAQIGGQTVKEDAQDSLLWEKAACPAQITHHDLQSLSVAHVVDGQSQAISFGESPCPLRRLA